MFVKRRLGALRKLMQLSKLTDCNIQLKIYNKEDQSLLEYYSDKNMESAFENFGKLKSHVKLTNDDFNFIERIE